MKKISIAIVTLIVLAVIFFITQTKTRTASLPDLVITEVKNINVSDYEITVQNKGDGDATGFIYICMWSESYAAKGKPTTCNGGALLNNNKDVAAGDPVPLKAGSSQIAKVEGVYGLTAHEKLFFVVDKSDNPTTDNSVSELDETNNTYVLVR